MDVVLNKLTDLVKSVKCVIRTIRGKSVITDSVSRIATEFFPWQRLLVTEGNSFV